MYRHTNIPERVHTIKFSIGYVEEHVAWAVLDDLCKIDPKAQIVYNHAGTMRKGKYLAKALFFAIVEVDAERELFFKLKLKYPEFRTEDLLSLYG